MNDIVVSIWCLAYNHEKYIRTALEGFVMQKTNFKYEIIIHDDASTDRTTEIIKEYELKYPDIIKPIYSKENKYSKGADRIHSELLKKSNGRYIAYCEGDDYWIDENKLQTQVNILESNNDVVLCTHKVECVKENDDVLGKFIPNFNSKEKINQNNFAKIIFNKNTYPFHTCSYLLKREVLLSEIFQNLMHAQHYNADMWIMLTTLSLGNVYYIDKVMSRRRMLTDNNYNNRFNSLTLNKKQEQQLRLLDGIIQYDNLSDKKYHMYISSYIFLKLAIYSSIYGDKSKEMLASYKENNKFSFFCSIKYSVIYYLFISFPKLLRNIAISHYEK